MYRVDQKAVPRGTSNQGRVRGIPKRVQQLYGPPNHHPNDAECLGSYVFVGEGGAVFELYCMAYDAPAANTKKARAAFWNHTGIVDLKIGAKDAASGESFGRWIEEKLARGPPL